MPTLTITRGLPGSGKTTWAKTQSTGVRVNRDDLRRMLWAGPWPHGDRTAEAMCTVAQHAQIEALLGSGWRVVVDDTNLNSDDVDELRHIARRCGAEVVVQDFTDVPLQTCIDRDAARPADEQVGADQIRAMWARYLAEQGRTTP